MRLARSRRHHASAARATSIGAHALLVLLAQWIPARAGLVAFGPGRRLRLLLRSGARFGTKRMNTREGLDTYTAFHRAPESGWAVVAGLPAEDFEGPIRQSYAVLGGSIVVEAVFNWPGLGRLLVDAVNMRDYPVIQTLVLLFSLEFILINLLVDMAYGFINPTIRYK